MSCGIFDDFQQSNFICSVDVETKLKQKVQIRFSYLLEKNHSCC